MAVHLPADRLEEIRVSAVSLKSSFERLACHIRGNQPKIRSSRIARQTSHQTCLQILDHALQAISAQANFETGRAVALLEQG